MGKEQKLLVTTYGLCFLLNELVFMAADPSGRAVSGMGFRPLACSEYGFKSRRGHGCLSLVSVVCCQVEVSATWRSLVQMSTTDCGASECDI
jgi:hypothetical protein